MPPGGMRERSMKFSLLIEQDEEGRYVVECTDLPGYMIEGETLDEAIGNINEAIIGCIKSRGEEIGVRSW